MKQYQNLIELLVHNEDAEDYFKKLPDYVRDVLSAESENVHSKNELFHAVDHILGDD